MRALTADFVRLLVLMTFAFAIARSQSIDDAVRTIAGQIAEGAPRGTLAIALDNRSDLAPSVIDRLRQAVEKAAASPADPEH